MDRQILDQITDAVLELLGGQKEECNSYAQHNRRLGAELMLHDNGELAIISTSSLSSKELHLGEEEVDFGEVDKALKEKSDFFRDNFRTVFRAKALRVMAK